MAKPIKMIAKNSQTYLGYLNELLNECNNSYHHPIGKNAIDGDYFAFTDKIQINVAEVTPIIGQEKYL